MNALKYVAALAAVGILGLGAGVASAQESKAPEAGKAPMAATPAAKSPSKTASKAAKESEHYLSARGEVTAVDSTATPPPMPLKGVKGKAGKTRTSAGPSSAKILEGKTTKAIADLTAGERVRVTYDRTQDKLEADQIHILKAAKSKVS